MSVIKIEFDTNDSIVTSAVAIMMNNINGARHDKGINAPAAPVGQTPTAPVGQTPTAPVGQTPTVDPIATPVLTEKNESIVLTPKEELDEAGLPYDKRIHSRTASKGSNGTWKLKRKPKEFETVEQWEQYITDCRAEVIGSTPAAPAAPIAAPAIPPAAPAAPIAAPAIPPAPSGAANAEHVEYEEPIGALMNIPENAPSVFADAAPAAPVAPAGEPVTFGSLMNYITANGIPKESVDTIIARHGVEKIPLLSQRPDLMPLILADLKTIHNS